MNLTFDEYAAQARLTSSQQDEVRRVLHDPTPDPRPFEEWSYLVARILDDVSFDGGGSTWPGQDLRRDLVTGVYDPVDLTLDGTEQALTPPSGATHCLITVTEGSARVGLRRADTAPILVKGDLVKLTGLQLVGTRLKRDGAAPASVRVDFWRVD